MSKFGIGQAVRRVEDQRFTTGAGQFVAELARPLGQTDHGELFGDDLIDLLLRHPAQFEPEGDVFLDRAPRQQSELLEHHGDAAGA